MNIDVENPSPLFKFELIDLLTNRVISKGHKMTSYEASIKNMAFGTNAVQMKFILSFQLNQ